VHAQGAAIAAGENPGRHGLETTAVTKAVSRLLDQLLVRRRALQATSNLTATLASRSH
jgi:hypothetical protein